MSLNEQTEQQVAAEPSQLNGQLKSAQGTLYSAVGSVLAAASDSAEWTASGKALQEVGQKEVDEAKARKAADATWDAAGAKLKSATGYLTGNQQKQTEGNLENEQAQWSYKQATSDGITAIPLPSVDGVNGKIESVVGMVTGDQERQKEGNLRAEKAAWKEGL